MVFEKGESSRAGEEAAAEQEASSGPVARQQQRAWVALSSIPVVVHRPGDARAAALAPGAADLLLELQDPPRASYLALPQRLVPDPRGLAPFYNYPYIITAAPGSLLFMATDLARGRNGVNSNYFLCDVRAATAKRLPAVPADLPIELSPRRTIGLVADPSSPGDYMITQLHPDATMRRHDALLCFSTATDQWFVKELADAPDHEPWGAHGVFPYDGLLWWVDVVYGMLFCNPFDDQPRLRLVPLPNGCAMPGLANRVYFSRLLDKRRCVRLSEGKLRYIQITGFSYNLATINDPPDNPTVSMWTLKALADQEDGDPWTAEYEVAFADIWNHHKYIDAGLPWGKVPNLALVDPNNHYVIYFFHERSLFAWDADAADIVSCEECLVDRDFLDLELQYSRFVEAWEWDPASSYGGNGTTGPDDAEELDAVIGSDEELASLLSQMEVEGEDMAPPSEPSVEADNDLDSEEEDIAHQFKIAELYGHGRRPCICCIQMAKRRQPRHQIMVPCFDKASLLKHYDDRHKKYMEANKKTRVKCLKCGNWLSNSLKYKRHKRLFH